MLINKILVLLLIASLSMTTFVSNVRADFTKDISCDIDTGIYQELLYNGSAILLNNTFTCSAGCAYNGLECNLPIDVSMVTPIVLFVFGLAALFIYLSFRIDDEHNALKLLFFFMSFIYMIFGSYVLAVSSLLTVNGLNDIMNASMLVGIWTFIFVFMYFFIMLFRELLDRIQKRKAEGKKIKFV